MLGAQLRYSEAKHLHRFVAIGAPARSSPPVHATLLHVHVGCRHTFDCRSRPAPLFPSFFVCILCVLCPVSRAARAYQLSQTPVPPSEAGRFHTSTQGAADVGSQVGDWANRSKVLEPQLRKLQLGSREIQ